MYAFTAPSGAGKTTVVRHLLQRFDWLDFSISATTRQRRDHEAAGVDYYFLSVADFLQRANDGAFIEWEEVYADQYYGTLHSEVNRVSAAGKCIVFDIDVKGAANLKRVYGEDCLVTFISPPSIEVLESRLRARDTESPQSLAKRIDKVRQEMLYRDDFDTVLYNDVLEVTLHDAEAIVSNFATERSIKTT